MSIFAWIMIDKRPIDDSATLRLGKKVKLTVQHKYLGEILGALVAFDRRSG